MKKPSTMVIKCMGKLMANWEANAAIVEHLWNKNITSKIFQNQKESRTYDLKNITLK